MSVLCSQALGLTGPANSVTHQNNYHAIGQFNHPSFLALAPRTRRLHIQKLRSPILKPRRYVDEG